MSPRPGQGGSCKTRIYWMTFSKQLIFLEKGTTETRVAKMEERSESTVQKSSTSNDHFQVAHFHSAPPQGQGLNGLTNKSSCACGHRIKKVTFTVPSTKKSLEWPITTCSFLNCHSIASNCCKDLSSSQLQVAR